jgi:hypothetical protein
VELTFACLFALWAITLIVMFAKFLLSLWRLLGFLESHHHQRWVSLTTYESLAWGPGVFVWKKYRSFLRDDSDDLGDNEVRGLKQRASKSYRRLFLWSTVGPLVLVLLFVAMMVHNITNR